MEECNSITIPASVTSIGDSSFSYMENLTINFGGTRAQWNALNVGFGGGTNATVHCSDD